MSDLALRQLDRLVGTWTTEATHPAMPGVVVRGQTIFEWLEGERFLVCRARSDHPDFPDSISIIGHMDRDRVGEGPTTESSTSAEIALSMHYFDSRGVFRVFGVTVDETAWRFWRDASGFSQRFTGELADAGDTIRGRSQLCRDDVHWHDDLEITYRRTS